MLTYVWQADLPLYYCNYHCLWITIIFFLKEFFLHQHTVCINANLALEVYLLFFFQEIKVFLIVLVPQFFLYWPLCKGNYQPTTTSTLPLFFHQQKLCGISGLFNLQPLESKKPIGLLQYIAENLSNYLPFQTTTRLQQNSQSIKLEFFWYLIMLLCTKKLFYKKQEPLWKRF